MSGGASVARAVQILLAPTGAAAAARWFALIVWTFCDIESRSRSVVAQICSTLVVVLSGVPGGLLYAGRGPAAVDHALAAVRPVVETTSQDKRAVLRERVTGAATPGAPAGSGAGREMRWRHPPSVGARGGPPRERSCSRCWWPWSPPCWC